MKCDYQDLQSDDLQRRYWSHGRIWLRRAGEWYSKRAGTLRIEWCAPPSGWHWGLTFGGGDSGRDFGGTFSVPVLITLYVTLENVFPLYWFGWTFEQGHDREIGCAIFEGTFRYSLWVGTMASWSRDAPWCRWWRQGHFTFADLLGKTRYARHTITADIPVVIPMPEGVYLGTATIERATWKRPLWFATTRISTTIDCPKGIPFSGKGENSWDCGDDGLFGWGVEGASVEKAIGHGVEIVLSNRRRYGMPSAQAIQKALA